MNLFHRPPPPDVAQRQRLKAWVYATLNLEAEVPVSISQLQCNEPGCPPVETVIAIMSQPPQTFKIHAAVAAITEAQLRQALQASLD